MSNPIELPALDFRKKITNQFHLRQIQSLAEQWAVSPCEACWRIITDRIAAEMVKKENNIISKPNNEVPHSQYNSPGKEA